MRHTKSRKNILSGLIGLLLITVAAVWQFYVFVTFRNAHGVVDAQGGISHLWLAVGLVVIACIAAFFFFSGFLRHDRSDELHITSPPPPSRAS